MAWDILEKVSYGPAIAPDAVLLFIRRGNFKCGPKTWLTLKLGRQVAAQLVGTNPAAKVWFEFALGRDEHKGGLRLRQVTPGVSDIRAKLNKRGVATLNGPLPATWGGRDYRAIKLRHELITDRAGLTLIVELPLGWETEPTDAPQIPARAMAGPAEAARVGVAAGGRSRKI